MGTAVAVGCAVGVPAFIVIVGMAWLMMRQQRRIRREIDSEAKNRDFVTADCDLDDIVDEQSTVGRSRRSVGTSYNRDAAGAEAGEVGEAGGAGGASEGSEALESESSGGSGLASKLGLHKKQKQAADGATEDTRNDGHAKRSNTTRYNKSSRVMGLRVVPRSQLVAESSSSSSSGVAGRGHGKSNSQTLTDQMAASSVATTPLALSGAGAGAGSGGYFNPTAADSATKAHHRAQSSQQNFMNYYESVIPMLPSAAGTSSSVASSIESPSRDNLGATGSNNSQLLPPGALGSADGTNSISSSNRASSPARGAAGNHSPSASAAAGAGTTSGINGDGSKSTLLSRKSQMSLQNEYIRQLNKADSPQFPKGNVINASPSQINMLNNYAVHRGGSNSSISLTARQQNSRVTPSHSSLGIYQMKGQQQKSEEESESPSHDVESVGSPVLSVESAKHDETLQSDITPQNDSAVPAADTTVYQTPAVNTAFDTPFDTPPRHSQYLSPVDTEFNETFESKSTLDPKSSSSNSNSNKNSNSTSKAKSSKNAEHEDNGDEDEFKSNYTSNKREWLKMAKTKAGESA